MPKQKFLILLQTATEEEFKNLRWFLQSGYHVTDTNLLALYEAVSKYYPAFDSKALGRERLFKKVFPVQNFDDDKWRNLASKMKKAIEVYFIQLEMEIDEPLKKRLFSRALGRRNLFNWMKKNVLAASTTPEDTPNRQTDKHYEQYRLLREVIFRPESKKNLRELDELLQKTMGHLDLFYTTEWYRLQLIFQSLTKATNSSHAERNVKPPKEFPGNPLIRLFSALLQLLETGDKLLFFEVKRMLFANVNLLTKTDFQIVIPLLINFGIAETIRDEKTFLEEIFDLYKLGLQQDVLTVEGKLTDATFSNIVSSSVQMKEFEWTTDFITCNAAKLEQSSKESVVALAWAKWHFGKKDFSSTIESLRSANFKSPLLERNFRILLLRSHFELYLLDDTYLNLLKFEIMAFEKYIKRNKYLTKNTQSACLNLSEFLKKLIYVSSAFPLDRDKSSQLFTSLNEYPVIVGRDWLFEKIQDLVEKTKPR
jgi:hypothetical protein